MADSPYYRKKHHPCINKRKRRSLTPKTHEYQNFFDFFNFFPADNLRSKIATVLPLAALRLRENITYMAPMPQS
jgi:hypothetical protein